MRSLGVQVPEFRVAYTITTDKLDSLYKKLKPKGVTMTALLAKAAGVALARHPIMYAGQHFSHTLKTLYLHRGHTLTDGLSLVCWMVCSMHQGRRWRHLCRARERSACCLHA